MCSLSFVVLGLLCVTLTFAQRYYDPPQSASPVRISEVPDIYRSYACTFDRVNYYQHGSVFHYSENSRCITYMCDRGQIYLRTEGCLNEDNGRCAYVRDTFIRIRFECHYFMCTKSRERDHFVYQTNRVKVECYDHLAQVCRSEREVFESIDETGRRRPGCTCQISQNQTRIACPNWQN